jgi:hypothetical protein
MGGEISDSLQTSVRLRREKIYVLKSSKELGLKWERDLHFCLSQKSPGSAEIKSQGSGGESALEFECGVPREG